ncbi:MAG TPA: glycosyl hydrolase family 18 protein [Bacillota bacterium]|jgi:spore germination protein|nr:glycosyl hydrolase family 18 protein [Bacillota bacterium]
MSTLVKERAVFAAVSILALAIVTLFGGSYAAPAGGGKIGPAEPEAEESYMLQPDVLPVLKAYAQEKGAADGKPSGQGQGEEDGEKQAEESEDRDTYHDENVTGSASRLGSRYVLGFYVDDEYILPSSYDRMLKHGKHISAVAPFWYRLSPADGSILQQHHPEEGFTDEKMKRIIDKAHASDMEVLMLVHNMLYGGKANGKELAKKMLATGESRKAFIDNVEEVLEKFGYDGINIDIESIYVADRDRFSALVKELYERLSPKGYRVTVCVPAKTSDNLKNTWSGPFDYKKIAKYSDNVIIMTYDEHGYSSGPGPVASYGWVRNVMKYAVGQIPAGKILMGVPGYGFDWTAGKKGARYISYSQAVNLASSKGAKVQWDSAARVPYFKYTQNGQSHEVWFESKFSLEHKLDIVKEYNVGGIALWRLGLEDAGFWDVIGKRIDAKK